MAPRPSSLTAAQRASLLALVDAFLPSLPVPESQQQTYLEEDVEAKVAIRRYWQHTLSSDASFCNALETVITTKLCESDRFNMILILNMLASPVGTSLLFGTLSLQSFADEFISMPDKTQLLQQLQHSRVEVRRKVFMGLKRLICGLAYSHTTAGKNPFWEAMGYPGAPQYASSRTSNDNNLKALSASDDTRRTFAAMSKQAPLQQALVDLPMLASQTIPGDDEPFTEDPTVECDVLIVGSGAGGCVAASVLARAGYDVLVVDKGPFLSPAEITNLEEDAFDRMYEQHGLLTTKDGAVSILAGSTIGGGTSVNWSCCLPMPDYVREEWAKEHGLDAFQAGGEYEKALNYILIKIGALDKSKVKHNPMNRKLQEGCDIMGYRWATTGQSMYDQSDPAASFLCFGDRYGNKRSGVSVFLRDAVKHGALLADQCRVSRLLKTNVDRSLGNLWNMPFSARPKASGAVCELENGVTVRISAKKAVIVSAGALQTPCILKRSGLRNRHIGKHLRLHPVAGVCGIMDAEEKIDSFWGAPMTTVCSEFELGPLGDGYGARIECPNAHTGILASNLVWSSPVQFKKRLQQLRNSVPFIVLQRDSGEGSVNLARDGVTPVVSYRINDADKASMTRTVCGGLQMLITAGAKEVTSGHIRDPGLKLGDGPYSLLRMAGDNRIQGYLSFVSQQGMRAHEVAISSAHQMGTCRMSTSPTRGAVDVNGETWDWDNLFVMDSSTFPTATGVNPMITVFVIAKMLSARLALRLRNEDQMRTGMAEAVKAKEFIESRKALRRPKAEKLFSKLPVPSHVVLWTVAAVLLLPLLLGWVFGGTSIDEQPTPKPTEAWYEDLPYADVLPYSLMWTAVFSTLILSRPA